MYEGEKPFFYMSLFLKPIIMTGLSEQFVSRKRNFSDLDFILELEELEMLAMKSGVIFVSCVVVTVEIS